MITSKDWSENQSDVEEYETNLCNKINCTIQFVSTGIYKNLTTKKILMRIDMVERVERVERVDEN